MAPSLPPGEARPAPKPQPIGSFPFLFLFTTATVCVLFIIWRRSDTLRNVVGHQLKTWTRQEGAVRLSEDDGPPSHSFLGDDYEAPGGVEEGYDDGGGNGPANTNRAPPEALQRVGTMRTEAPSLSMGEDVSPSPPPKD